MLKSILRPLIPNLILTQRKLSLQKKELLQWHYNGCMNPPPNSVKQITIAYYQKKYDISTLIETGTYLGDMVEAQKNRFKKIVSIELSKQLFEKACKRFYRNKNILILQGDSSKVLYEVLNEIKEPSIFWLDGHFSGGITAKGDTDCPIFEELNAIFSTSDYNHILLIDDARLFVGKMDYPTVQELTEYVKSRNPKLKVQVQHDIIRYTI